MRITVLMLVSLMSLNAFAQDENSDELWETKIRPVAISAHICELSLQREQDKKDIEDVNVPDEHALFDLRMDVKSESDLIASRKAELRELGFKFVRCGDTRVKKVLACIMYLKYGEYKMVRTPNWQSYDTEACSHSFTAMAVERMYDGLPGVSLKSMPPVGKAVPASAE